MLSGRETKYIQLCAYNYGGKMKRVRGKYVQIIPHVYIIYLMYNARGTSALSPERITGYLKDSRKMKNANIGLLKRFLNV